MSTDPIDLQIVKILSAAGPNDIDGVISLLGAIDGVLPSDDGLKWFNWLYLMVTRAVKDNPPAGGFNDPQWVTRLDVVFAELYFAAVNNFLRQSPDAQFLAGSI